MICEASPPPADRPAIPDSMLGQFTSAESALAFMLAGNATITLVSKKTGVRFTFQVRAGDSGDVHFVSLLRGADNTADYSYLGRIAGGAAGKLWIGRKVPKPGDIGRGAPSALAFDYAWQHMARGNIPPLLEVWHEGRCGRCGRKLTVPASIESGFGPECATKV
jgi:Family of unknown function (DUF6011)